LDWLLPALLCACIAPRVTLLPTPPPRAAAALAAAAEAFYAAKDPAAMRAALAAARAAGADTAIYHELAAELARCEGRPVAVVDHLIQALRDPANDATVLHLHRLQWFWWTLEQRATLIEVFRELAASHRDPAVRALASQRLVVPLRWLDDDAGSKRAQSGITGVLPLAVIGAWDNDQGKGFETKHPPEEKIDFGARYPGAVVEIGWRREPPRGAWGTLSLSELFTPSQWALAYAVGAVRAPAAGDYELRLWVTTATKVWVNGGLVFESPELDTGGSLDVVTLPVRLRQGANRVLVKTAQRTGRWRVLVRVTRPGGAVAAELEPLPPDTEPALGEPPGAPRTLEDLLDAHVRALPPGARRAAQRIRWAHLIGSPAREASAAEGLLAKHPQSLVGRLGLALALWRKGERDRVADLLSALDRETGQSFARVRLYQIRFWEQQQFGQKARERLVALSERYPDLPQVRMELSYHYRKAGWREDECRVLAQVARRWPTWADVEEYLARCWTALGLQKRAMTLLREVVSRWPGLGRVQGQLADLEAGRQDFASALRHASAWTRAFPWIRAAWKSLGELRRRAGDSAGAEEAFRRATQIDPDWPDAYEALGRLAWQDGDRPRAIQHWRAALERNPKNSFLDQRLEFLAPTARAAWAKDVPDEPAIEKAIGAGRKISPPVGAEVVALLDDSVTELQRDGSSVGVVTRVLRAMNQRGRDRLTHLTMSRGQNRVLYAYAIDAAGRRAEAASIRGISVRFQGLKVGSTVVLQYRTSTPPLGYLARHIARQWFFQAAGQQTRLSRFVLWAPAGTKLHEDRSPEVRREERTVGSALRVAWTAEDVKPLVPEAFMPPVADIALHLFVSSVPDWETYLHWEAALLQEAFRESPELVAFADKLLQGADTVQEKVSRIQRHLAEEIRYQRDYENHIAGVKPHPATTVLQRGYGDCKDKAVLFMTLARRAGIEAHYALLRTRKRGRVRRAIPMQQFDHAIVYLPPQAGLAEGRFYDPTAESLDVGVTPVSDAGALSLVYDPRTGRHEWREIPLDPPEAQFVNARVQIRIAADGSGTGELDLSLRGPMGALFRRLGRSPALLKQVLQVFLAQLFPGATITATTPVNLVDVRQPARVRVAFRAPMAAQREGTSLRFKVLSPWPLRGVFLFPERRYPLRFGAMTFAWRYEIEMPPGWTAKRLPSPEGVEARCMKFAERAEAGTGKVTIERSIVGRCEEIPVSEYAQHRAMMETIDRHLAQDIVLGRAEGLASAPR
jgi:tetratricopeptide (TPR) repeat protein/transglutaminase-like putative cysteine protease